MKNIIISGASGNLGKDVMDQLLTMDHHLYVTTGSHYGGEFDGVERVDHFQVDLLDSTAAHTFVADVIQKSSHVHAGVFLVGGYSPGNLLATNDQDIEKMIQLNFFTAFHLVQPLIAHFKENGGGQIIFIGAKGAVNTDQGDANFAYTLSKSMLVKMAEMINSEYEGQGITATVIAPSTIDTPVNRKAMPHAEFSKWISPKDIANSISFILSETGEKIRQPILKMYNQT